MLYFLVFGKETCHVMHRDITVKTCLNDALPLLYNIEWHFNIEHMIVAFCLIHYKQRCLHDIYVQTFNPTINFAPTF